MGKIILDQNGKPRELVKVKSDNPTHAGFYTTYRDEMGPEDELYEENEGKGLTVAEIKKELEALEVEIPAGVTKKAELLELLEIARLEKTE